MSSQIVGERSTTESSVSYEVVSAVAARKGVAVREMEPLYDVIDPDALDALYRSVGSGRGDSLAHVEFSYSGCHVTIDGDGSVSVSRVE